MKESEIRKKAIEILRKSGWAIWYPFKSKWAKEQDIFGVYDLVAAKDSVVRFIQLTTVSNIRARERKVRKFLTFHNLFLNSEVWGWKKNGKCFKAIKWINKYEKKIERN